MQELCTSTNLAIKKTDEEENSGQSPAGEGSLKKIKILVSPYFIWVSWLRNGGKSATLAVAKAAAVTCLHTVFAVPAHSALVPHVMGPCLLTRFFYQKGSTSFLLSSVYPVKQRHYMKQK